MKSSVSAGPGALADEMASVIRASRPTAGDILDLQEQLLTRHAELGLRPVVSSEEVVEGFFRCRLAEYVAHRFNVGADDLPDCVNSSHRAVRRICVSPHQHRHLAITDTEWAVGWAGMQARFPAVNIRVPGRRSAKRADLYIVASRQIVSLEFKYVAGNSLRGVDACIEQMLRHAKHHTRALFVVYVAPNAAPDLARAAAGLLDNASLVTAAGPPIPPVSRGAA